MARKRKVVVLQVALACLTFCLLVGQGSSATAVDESLINELDQLDLDTRTVKRSLSGNICPFQEAIVRSVPETFITTIDKAFVAPCGYLANGVPINDDQSLCRFTRKISVTRQRQVFKREYKTVRKCCKGWTGINCTQNQKLCNPACQNGGVCVNRKCYCPNNYTGNHCQKAICVGGCQMGGKCIAPGICRCRPGYTGKNCELALISQPENELAMFNFKRDAPPTISEPNVCYTWGQSHYKTFDGKYYYFPGRCTYKLVADCEDDMFSIHVTNDPNCPKNKLCRRTVQLYLGGGDIRIELKERRVTINDEGVTLPHLVGKIVIKEVANYVVVHGFSGITVMWDCDNSVYVHISEEYKGKTCGLCGNFNGDPSDEFITMADTPVTSVVEFGNSFKMSDFGEVCPDTSPEQEASPCKKVSHEEFAKIQEYCATLLKSPFSKCHDAVNPTMFIKMCEEDACSCSNYTSLNNCICDALTQYSRACARNDIELSWRDELNICPKTCPATMVYTECGTACPKTCFHRDLKYVCDQHCVDGCTCPNGTYHDGQKCVREEECPCEHHREILPPGSIIRSGCNKCVCSSGLWSCTKDICPGICKATGDPHYRTFDGRSYDFMGSCHYIFARDCETNKFEVIVENAPCGRNTAVTCTKTVFVNIDGTSIVLRRGGFVTVNSVEPVLPYRGSGITIYRISIMIRLISDVGLKVSWNGRTRLYVLVMPHFTNKTCGLCGNYNNIQEDDYMNNDGAIETNVAAFANSWRTDPECDEAVHTKHPCELQVQREPEAKRRCAVLKKHPFDVCHHSVDPQDGYIQNCEYDVCGCQDGNMCYCSAIEDYVRECAEHGFIINWRNIDVVPECDVQCDNPDEVYQQCASSCYQTCRDLQENTGCVEECSPACHCPNNTVRDANDKCVHFSECYCHINGQDYEPGTSIWPNRCSICTCINGKFDCKNETCKGDECSLGRVWSTCGAQCPRTCENVHLPCLNAQCEEGCVCPENLVFNGSQCINASDCPCHHDGQHYHSGGTITVDCNTCVCADTEWQCTTNKCAKTCSAVGDPHYKTFDGKRYDFQGSCEYILAEDYCGSSFGSFRIEVENIPCGTGGVTCTRALTITLNNTVITLVRGEEPKIGALPGTQSTNLATQFELHESGCFLILTTSIGLTVVWDRGTRVYVNLQPTYEGTTCGLCGNLNGKQADDFTTPQGLIEELPNDFGDSWKVEPSCSDSKEIQHPCTTNKHRAPWAHKMCNIIRSPKRVFQPCHDKVDPTPFYENCYYDACGCDTGGDCECMCTAIAAYARECNRHGVHIQWRTKQLCPAQCEYGLQYVACGPACPTTCESLCKPSLPCPVPCTEGCHCPNGTVLNDDTCIKPDECPCILDGNAYPSGSYVIKNCQNCHCVAGCLTCTGPICSIPGKDGIIAYSILRVILI